MGVVLPAHNEEKPIRPALAALASAAAVATFAGLDHRAPNGFGAHLASMAGEPG